MQKKSTSTSHKHKPLYLHVARNFMFGIFLILVALFVGMVGYHFFEEMSWTDSFINASMILSGMGPLSVLNTMGGKIFAGVYALFSGLAFIAIMAVIFAPIIHQFFRKIHLDIDREK